MPVKLCSAPLISHSGECFKMCGAYNSVARMARHAQIHRGMLFPSISLKTQIKKLRMKSLLKVKTVDLKVTQPCHDYVPKKQRKLRENKHV